MVIGVSSCCKYLCFIHLETFQNQSSPTNSAEEPTIYGETGVLQERSADGGTVLKTYAPHGEMDSTNGTAVPLYYTRDHLGSVREVVASDGSVSARYDYTPYGERSRVSGTYEAAKGYTGHDYHADSGLILTRYRAYDPQLGRWLSPDPIEESGGMNLHEYVDGDPVNGVDPLGLETSTESSLGDWLAKNLGNQGSGSYVDGYARASAAMLDGFIPFGDPLSGEYNPCDDGMNISRQGGEYAQDLAMAVAGGKLIGKALGGLSKNRWIGRSSWLFGSGAFRLGNGVLNNNNVLRIGWGKKAGQTACRIAIGPKKQGTSKLINWLRHFDLL